MKVVNNILELIGETPVIKLSSAHDTGGAQVYVKLEGFNPGGSIKDRPGLYMIEQAEQKGKLKPIFLQSPAHVLLKGQNPPSVVFNYLESFNLQKRETVYGCSQFIFAR
jgi:hypothetical protein